LGVANDDRRTAVLCGLRSRDDLGRQTRIRIDALFHRFAVDDVFEVRAAADVRDDRRHERVPFGDELAGLDALAVALAKTRTVNERVPLALTLLAFLEHFDDRNLGVAVHDD